jgi:hypothetical protein
MDFRRESFFTIDDKQCSCSERMLTVGSDRRKTEEPSSIIPCRLYGNGTIIVAVCSYHHGEINEDTNEEIEKDVKEGIKEVPEEDPKSLAVWLQSHHDAINIEILNHYAEIGQRTRPLSEEISNLSMSCSENDDNGSAPSATQTSSHQGSRLRALPDGHTRSAVTKLTKDCLYDLQNMECASLFSDAPASFTSTAMTARRD